MNSDQVLLVTNDTLGQGPRELGERLVGAFFHALAEAATPPGAVVLMNAGVKLAVHGARTVEDLMALVARGVEVLACGTCLGYFEGKEQLAVGRVSNMYEITERLLEVKRVVSL